MKIIINLNYQCIVISIIMKLWLTLEKICKIRLLHFKKFNNIEIKFKILQFNKSKLIIKIIVLLARLNNNLAQNLIILMFLNKWIILLYQNEAH